MRIKEGSEYRGLQSFGMKVIPLLNAGRLTTLHVSSEAEKGESQLQNKRDRLTTLHVSSEAENGEPQLQNKRGIL